MPEHAQRPRRAGRREDAEARRVVHHDGIRARDAQLPHGGRKHGCGRKHVWVWRSRVFDVVKVEEPCVWDMQLLELGDTRAGVVGHEPFRGQRDDAWGGGGGVVECEGKLGGRYDVGAEASGRHWGDEPGGDGGTAGERAEERHGIGL